MKAAQDIKSGSNNPAAWVCLLHSKHDPGGHAGLHAVRDTILEGMDGRPETTRSSLGLFLLAPLAESKPQPRNTFYVDSFCEWSSISLFPQYDYPSVLITAWPLGNSVQRLNIPHLSDTLLITRNSKSTSSICCWLSPGFCEWQVCPQFFSHSPQERPGKG